MTVKELEAILCTIKNKDLDVCIDGFTIKDINGYFYGNNCGKDVLLLTEHNVQPRIPSEHEV